MTDFLDSVDERHRQATEALRGLLRADAQYAHRIYTFQPKTDGDSDRIWSVMAVELYGRICALLDLPPMFLPDEPEWATIVAYAVGQDSVERLQNGTMPGSGQPSFFHDSRPAMRVITGNTVYPDGGRTISYNDGTDTYVPAPQTTKWVLQGPATVRLDGQTRTLAAGETLTMSGDSFMISDS